MPVQEALWQVIAANDDTELTKLAVDAFAAMDAAELCRRALRQKDLPTWALSCVISSVPSSVAVCEGLDKLLPGEWETYSGIEARGCASQGEIRAIRLSLADGTLADENRRIAAIRAGSAR